MGRTGGTRRFRPVHGLLADAYALEVLQRIAAQLDGFGRTVQNGIRLLQTGERVAAEDVAREA